MDTPTARFRDPRSTVYDFLDLVLVRCPGCAGAARVVRVPGDEGPGGRRPFAARRLVCGGCGASRKCDGTRLTFPRGTADPVTDPYFGRPLWLRAETRHGTLWAYNLDHLDLIRRFVAASLRERAPWYDTGQKMTLVARLPVWVKRAGNRGEVLRALDRMRAGVPVERAEAPVEAGGA
ncbi:MULTISPECIES: hypothetical protein [Streptomyces]|uniref:hypothetical protein n=1 Tax=Streptomyces TaxID=1883 RepID=UPI0005250326|nr:MULTISPECIES: hypothetical protein [Streptomyces]NVI27826.1 hypothetical protein [Streptomyces sp. CAI-17]WAC96350.1 hypothetical protein OSU72_09435 [Streptomyces sp. NA13]